jgi:hypothetical protein
MTAVRMGNPGGFNFLPALTVRDRTASYTKKMTEFIGMGVPYREAAEDMQILPVPEVI